MKLKCVATKENEDAKKLADLGIENNQYEDEIVFVDLFLHDSEVMYCYDVSSRDSKHQLMIVGYNGMEFYVKKTKDLVEFLNKMFA